MSMTQQAHRIMTALGNGTQATAATFVYGTVVTAAPLSVNVDGRLTIPAEFLVLSPLCVRAEFNNFAPTEEEQSHKHNFNVGLWRGLQVGDKVAMIANSDNNQYLVLFRIDMIIGDMG